MKRWAALVIALGCERTVDLSARPSDALGPPACTPGASRTCYSGTPETRGVGVCHDGMQRCGPDGRWPASCEGERLPAALDACNYLDDDCDGDVDEGFVYEEASQQIQTRIGATISQTQGAALHDGVVAMAWLDGLTASSPSDFLHWELVNIDGQPLADVDRIPRFPPPEAQRVLWVRDRFVMESTLRSYGCTMGAPTPCGHLLSWMTPSGERAPAAITLPHANVLSRAVSAGDHLLVGVNLTSDDTFQVLSAGADGVRLGEARWPAPAPAALSTPVDGAVLGDRAYWFFCDTTGSCMAQPTDLDGNAVDAAIPLQLAGAMAVATLAALAVQDAIWLWWSQDSVYRVQRWRPADGLLGAPEVLGVGEALSTAWDSSAGQVHACLVGQAGTLYTRLSMTGRRLQRMLPLVVRTTPPTSCTAIATARGALLQVAEHDAGLVWWAPFRCPAVQ